MKHGQLARKDYWERNIAGFSGFYDTGSEENLYGSSFITSFYRALILPQEKKYMKIRYNMVGQFITDFVKPGMVCADIGCGSGVFSIMMAEKGATVNAYDFADAAIGLTEGNTPAEHRDAISAKRLDITSEPIGDCDLAISIGVLPYVDDAEAFLNNICPHTDKLLFNFLERSNPLNAVRRALPTLDVRGYSYHSRQAANETLKRHGFDQIEHYPLATGFMISAARSQARAKAA